MLARPEPRRHERPSRDAIGRFFLIVGACLVVAAAILIGLRLAPG